MDTRSNEVRVADTAPRASLRTMTLAAIGVVFGDIGTSPLYTLHECIRSIGGEHFTRADLLGILSLIFWALTLVVTIKYLAFVMRADNRGEGGIFALLAILPERLRTRRSAVQADYTHSRALGVSPNVPQAARLTTITLMVIVGAALLYGDGSITPAISVLSAIEGLTVVQPRLAPLVVPLTCAILLALFAVQKQGTGAIGRCFSPVMLIWFGSLAGLGLYHIAHQPEVLVALSPHYAVRFFTTHGVKGGVVLGSVVLAVTGGEALYADMGHFGVKPIRIAWLCVAMPALLLCYFGQGALLLRMPAAIENPFFRMVPEGSATLALVILSSAATVIASQALISGAFSLTRQAMQLGYFPRVTVQHTARQTEGQIYIPQINWMLGISCIVLVLGFRRAEHLAAAYGIAVTGTMAITSVVYYAVLRHAFGWARSRALPVLALFLAIDLPFFVANIAKIAHGGWVPLAVGLLFVVAMLVWSRGRALMIDEFTYRFPSLEDALPRLRERLFCRTPGTAVFMTPSTTHVPPILMHFVDRSRVLAETVILATVVTEGIPVVPQDARVQLEPASDGFHRVLIRCGFMEQPNVPALIAQVCAEHGVSFVPDETTYYLGRQNFLATDAGRMGRLGESLFAFLQRNAVAADRHFGIPPLLVVEIGVQLDL